MLGAIVAIELGLGFILKEGFWMGFVTEGAGDGEPGQAVPKQ
jgi:hypothetical protein